MDTMNIEDKYDNAPYEGWPHIMDDDCRNHSRIELMTDVERIEVLERQVASLRHDITVLLSTNELNITQVVDDRLSVFQASMDDLARRLTVLEASRQPARFTAQEAAALNSMAWQDGDA